MVPFTALHLYAEGELRADFAREYDPDQAPPPQLYPLLWLVQAYAGGNVLAHARRFDLPALQPHAPPRRRCQSQATNGAWFMNLAEKQLLTTRG